MLALGTGTQGDRGQGSLGKDGINLTADAPSVKGICKATNDSVNKAAAGPTTYFSFMAKGMV